jgi:uncharacterized membrane protein
MSDYSLLSAPSPPIFTFNSGTKTISGNPSTAGKYYMIYGLTVTDGTKTGTAIMTFVVNVQNQAATVVAQINSASPVVGAVFSLAFDPTTFVDPENDQLSY